jgi:hypothetical protein
MIHWVSRWTIGEIVVVLTRRTDGAVRLSFDSPSRPCWAGVREGKANHCTIVMVSVTKRLQDDGYVVRVRMNVELSPSRSLLEGYLSVSAGTGQPPALDCSILPRTTSDCPSNVRGHVMCCRFELLSLLIVLIQRLRTRSNRSGDTPSQQQCCPKSSSRSLDIHPHSSMPTPAHRT